MAQTYVFDGTLNAYTGTSNPNLPGTATTGLDLGLGTPGANDTRVLRTFATLGFGGAAPASLGGFAMGFEVANAPGEYLASIALRGNDNPDVIRFNANVAAAKSAHGVIVWPTTTDTAFNNLQLTLDTRVTLGGGGRFHKVVRAGGQYYVSAESFSSTNGNWPLSSTASTTWQAWDFTASGGNNFVVDFSAPTGPTNAIVDAIGVYFVATSNSAIVHDISRMGWASSAVSDVSVTPAEFFLLPGNSRSLEAQIVPESATNQNVTWSSSDENVATVDASGTVTAVGVGTATITVTTEDGGFTASSEVTVTLATVTGVSVAPTELSLQKSYTGQLTAEVLPASSINKNVTWSSSDEDVATVDQDGLVTAVEVGEATITVTTEEGDFTAQAAIEVVPALVTSVTILPGSRDVLVGQTVPFTVAVEPAAAANKNVTWTSLNADVATVSGSGQVTGIIPGTATIRVTSDDGGFTDEATVNVVTLPAPTPETGLPRIAATNLHWVRDWLPPILADVLQNTAGIRIWAQLNTEDPVAVDADGWPTSDARIWLWHNQPNPRLGTYTLTFEGQATVAFTSPAMVVQSNVYDANTESSVVTLSLVAPTTELRMSLTNTNGGVRNVKLMRPVAPGATESHGPDEVVDRVMRDQLARLDIIRYMDPSNINANPEIAWSDRRLPDKFQNRRISYSVAGSNMRETGVAWEYIIAIANATMTDAYICLPAMADDDYITKVAQMFRYGSDGVNPYTEPQANPVWAPLDPDLKLYVEYSNENWNTGGAFPQSTYVANRGIALVTADLNHTLNYDGFIASADQISSNGGNLRLRYSAYRASQMSRLFRDVFPDEMMTRVRPLWCYQVKQNNTDDVHGLDFISGYYASSEGLAPSYFFWGAGPANYRAAGSGATIDTVWTTGQMDRATFKTRMTNNARMIASYGIPFVTYEGGPAFGDRRVRPQRIRSRSRRSTIPVSTPR